MLLNTAVSPLNILGYLKGDPDCSNSLVVDDIRGTEQSLETGSWNSSFQIR